MRNHLANCHDIGVTWYSCTECTKRFKQPGNLKRHLANVHDIGVEWKSCKYCADKFKEKGNLNQHMANKHNICVVWHACDKCTQKFKNNSDLKRHMANKHDIGVKWNYCHLCPSKFKQNPNLKKHLGDVHNINVKWHMCEHCSLKFKQKSNLKQHQSNVHDIGKHQCSFCLRNRNSSIVYNDNHGKHKICRECFKKTTGKSSRVETVMSKYLDKHIGTEYLLGSDVSLKSMGGCQRYRPDKIYIGKELVIIIECDEHQHKWHNGTYKCDERRISDIYEEEGICGKKLAVIRWNPDHYKTKRNVKKIKRTDRLVHLVDYFNKILVNPPVEPIHVYYMFYDNDNPRICANLPFTMVEL